MDARHLVRLWRHLQQAKAREKMDVESHSDSTDNESCSRVPSSPVRP
jgi:hypothetical protein